MIHGVKASVAVNSCINIPACVSMVGHEVSFQLTAHIKPGMGALIHVYDHLIQKIETAPEQPVITKRIGSEIEQVF
jgi:hypothetical protein